MIVSFNLKYSLFLGYYGVGSDYWRHLADNNLLSKYGFIEVLSAKEPYYPLMHIQVAITDIITHTPIKDATNFAIIIPLVISSICIFLVARNILNAKVGLLAMLIVNITDYHTYWGAAPTDDHLWDLPLLFPYFLHLPGCNNKVKQKNMACTHTIVYPCTNLGSRCLLIYCAHQRPGVNCRIVHIQNML